jgi:hypothetical protein
MRKSPCPCQARANADGTRRFAYRASASSWRQWIPACAGMTVMGPRTCTRNPNAVPSKRARYIKAETTPRIARVIPRRILLNAPPRARIVTVTRPVVACKDPIPPGIMESNAPRSSGPAPRTSPRRWYNVAVSHAGVAELVDAPDSKSGGARAPCRFEPDLRYRQYPCKTNEKSKQSKEARR